MILLDTSALVASLSQFRPGWTTLRRLIDNGELLALSSLVLFEWRRGPRTPAELAHQQELFADTAVLPFAWEDAVLAAELYRHLPRARARSMDIALAASALRHRAALWTLNPADFADIPGLKLVAARA